MIINQLPIKTTKTSPSFIKPAKGIVQYFAASFLALILVNFFASNANADITKIATTPISSSGTQTVLPNIMYVLDDSGSMSFDYLPDWADPSVNPAYLSRNSDFNGIAYNPNITYTPPLMYNSDGSANTTKFLSQTSANTSTYSSVKDDAYGIQSTSSSNLVGRAYSYSTVAGEFCDGPQFKNCQTAQDATFKYPAKLRWCKTLAATTAATSASNGGLCQATNITGSYIYARTPVQQFATITIGSATSITAIAASNATGSPKILSSTVTGSGSTLAANIAANINLCTYGIPAGSNCTAVGFSATSSSTKVTIYAPNVMTTTSVTATPVVTPSGSTVTAFTAGTVPGAILMNVITNTVTGTYPKASTRSDCAGTTTCTYDEEMTNYANWWTYYHTRMQTMKTGVSIAFGPVDANYRVGFFTINNGGKTDYIDIAPFQDSQKYNWYSKFFNSTPFGPTPLRNALATAGRIYAGKVSSLNTLPVTDPVQYSCQQNFTILSTDGYWNDPTNPKQIDGTTDIGEQDDRKADGSTEDRPYLDGATQQQTITQTRQTITHINKTTFNVQQTTNQIQSSTSRLTQTINYPYTVSTSKLQRNVTPLNQTTYKVQEQNTKLRQTTSQLQVAVQTLNSTSYPLQQTLSQLQRTDSLLYVNTTRLSSTSYHLQKSTSTSTNGGDTYGAYTVFANTATCTPDAVGNASSSPPYTKTQCQYASSPDATLTTTGQASCTTKGPATSTSYDVPLIVTCSYDSSASPALATAQCQTAAKGDTNLSTYPSSSFTRNLLYSPGVTCSYTTQTAINVTSASSPNTCTVKTKSTSSPYTVLTATACSYLDGTATNVTSGSCTSTSKSSGSANNTVYSVTQASICAYSPTASGPATTGLTSCTPTVISTFANGTSTSVYNKIVCGKDSASSPQLVTSCGSPSTCTNNTLPSSFTAGTAYNQGVAYSYTGGTTSDVTSGSCVWANQSAGPTYSVINAKTCSYANTTSSIANSSCVPVAQSTGSTDGTSWTVLTAKSCAYVVNQTTQIGTVGTAATCTKAEQGLNPVTQTISTSRVDCGYATALGWADVTATPNTDANPNSCTTRATTASPGTATSLTGPGVACQYVAVTSNVLASTCSALVQSSASPYTVINATTCLTPAGGTASTNSPVDTCTPGTSTDTAGKVTTTTCAYNAYSTAANANTCTGTSQTSTTTQNVAALTATTCSVANSQQNVSTCTSIGTISPLTYNGSGTNVQCANINTQTATYVNTCSVGNGSSPDYLHTTCSSPITDSVTFPVDPSTCSNGLSSSAPYTTSQCDLVSSSSIVNSCNASTQTTSPWQTTTCQTLGGTPNTLADVAQYYWKTDLRSPALGNCPGTSGPLCPVDDPNIQRMNTITLGLGASGLMQYVANYKIPGTSADYDAVLNGSAADSTKGICSWQLDGSTCNWPIPLSDNQSGVDDLWHAGVNGRADYFSATDPTSLSNSLSKAIASIGAATASGGAASTSNPNVVAGDNFIFGTNFVTQDWTGEVTRTQIDAITGAVSTTPDWTARAKLDAKVYTTRTIWTFNTSGTNNLLAFNVNNYGSNTAYFGIDTLSAPVTGLSQFLCTSSDICLNGAQQSDASGPNLVKFLMGDRTNEGDPKDNTKYYRLRPHVLGDIVNAEAVYVNVPNFNYADAGYTDFKASQSSRTPVVFAAANDGMLHAFAAKFSAQTEADIAALAADPTNGSLQTKVNTDKITDTTGGQELWAYIPSYVMPNLYKLADKNYAKKHSYFVDGTPVIGDVCVSPCATSSDWRTILVGGLNRGGTGYYALDITDPANPKGLWEFTDSSMGYTFGNPQIAKVKYTTGTSDKPVVTATWAVLVTSGYNNVSGGAGSGDGQGYLYILDASSGKGITGGMNAKLSTGVGSSSIPSGLSKIVAQVTNPDVDASIISVYGGDLLGNVWRFNPNVDTTNPTNPPPANPQLLATLYGPGPTVDGVPTNGPIQPITTKPEVSKVGDSTVVYVGTGQFLDPSDISNTNVQSVYAIKDDLSSSSSAIYANPRITTTSYNFVQQTLSTGSLCPDSGIANVCVKGQPIVTSTNNDVNFAKNNGWYLDLPHSGERINVDLALVFGLLAFNANTPSSSGCSLGGSYYGYAVNYGTGGPVSSSSKGVVGYYGGNYLASRPVEAMVNGQVTRYTTDARGITTPTKEQNGPLQFSTRRTSWRELPSDQ